MFWEDIHCVIKLHWKCSESEDRLRSSYSKVVERWRSHWMLRSGKPWLKFQGNNYFFKTSCSHLNQFHSTQILFNASTALNHKWSWYYGISNYKPEFTVFLCFLYRNMHIEKNLWTNTFLEKVTENEMKSS